MANTIKIPGIKAPVKNIYVFAGIGTVAGIVLFAYWRRSSSSGDEEGGTMPVADPAAADPYTQGSDAQGYNTVYPSAYSGSGFSQYGYDMYGNPLPPPTGATGAGGAYASNAAWADAAINYIERTGTTEAVASSAVSAVLGGIPVTTDQQSMFLRAVGVLGQPPQGYPAIRLKDTPAQPKPPPVKPPPKPFPGRNLGKPPRLHMASRTQTSYRIDWDALKHARSYEVFNNGILQGNVVTTDAVVHRLRRNTKYKVEVRGVGADGGKGPKSLIYVWTKK